MRNINPVALGGEPLEETDSFTYLGSIIYMSGGTEEEDIKSRIQKARMAFLILKKIWKSKQIKLNTKLTLFNSNVKSVLFYCSETWRITQKTLKRIQTFINKCLHRILHLEWPVKVSNTMLWERDQAAPSRKRNKEEKIEVDRTHNEKTNSKHHMTIACFEPPRKEKKRKAKKHLTERQERNGENGHKQTRMEDHGRRPMLPASKQAIMNVC